MSTNRQSRERLFPLPFILSRMKQQSGRFAKDFQPNGARGMHGPGRTGAFSAGLRGISCAPTAWNYPPTLSPSGLDSSWTPKPNLLLVLPLLGFISVPLLGFISVIFFYLFFFFLEPALVQATRSWEFW